MQMVWPGEGVQCVGNGSSGAVSRGLVQLLWKEVQHEDCAHAGRPGIHYFFLSGTCCAFTAVVLTSSRCR